MYADGTLTGDGNGIFRTEDNGDIRITGSAVILPCEEVRNDSRDTFVLSGKSRSVIRGIGREPLKPLQKEVSPMKTKTPKKRGVER